MFFSHGTNILRTLCLRLLAPRRVVGMLGRKRCWDLFVPAPAVTTRIPRCGGDTQCHGEIWLDWKVLASDDVLGLPSQSNHRALVPRMCPSFCARSLNGTRVGATVFRQAPASSWTICFYSGGWTPGRGRRSRAKRAIQQTVVALWIDSSCPYPNRRAELCRVSAGSLDNGMLQLHIMAKEAKGVRSTSGRVLCSPGGS